MTFDKESPLEPIGVQPSNEASVEMEEAKANGMMGVVGVVTRYRWTICALLFFATTINYIDRQVFGILGPTLQNEFGWTEVQYGDIVSWFSLAYGIGYLGMGRLMDKIGVRKGLGLSMIIWTLASMAHALARTVPGFSAARAALGLGESGNFPASIKTVAEWFPRKERALATGIFNAGTNVGALLAPILVPWVTLRWGWEWAFIGTGGLALLWIIAWESMYRDPEKHRRCSPAELAYIRSDAAEEEREHTGGMSWIRLLTHRQTWAFVIGKALTDPVWWFYLFWLPKFLDTEYGITLSQLALPLIVIYLVADVGSVAGGWISSTLISRGWSVNSGRKTAMLIMALLIVPTMFAPRVHALWAAVALVSLAAAAHQGWSANLFTTSSDLFPSRAVASVVGLGGFAGALSGWGFQRLTGWILQITNSNYNVVFLFCGFAYVTALLIMHLLAPRMTAAKLDVRQTA